MNKLMLVSLVSQLKCNLKSLLSAVFASVRMRTEVYGSVYVCVCVEVYGSVYVCVCLSVCV